MSGKKAIKTRKDLLLALIASLAVFPLWLFQVIRKSEILTELAAMEIIPEGASVQEIVKALMKKKPILILAALRLWE